MWWIDPRSLATTDKGDGMYASRTAGLMRMMDDWFKVM